MARSALAVAAAVVGVSCFVAMVRGQDEGTSQPALLAPPAELAQVVPASPTGEVAPRRAEPTPALRSSAFEASEPQPPRASPAPVRRPSAAERLKQVREGAARGVTAGLSSGRPVTGPVPSNPVDLSRRARPSAGVAAEVGDAPAVLPGEEGAAADGTTSVLKRAEERPSADRLTARRLLRNPGRNVEPAASAPAERTEETAAAEGEREAEPVRRPAGAREFSARSGGGDVALLTSQGPSLRIEATGPSSVLVGKEATCVVTVHNDGSSPATGIVLRVGLPEQVRVTAEGSVPDSGPPADGAPAQRLVWNIAQIPARGSERVTLRVTPTENSAIPLTVDWTMRPVAARAEIAVLQPQLELAVFGPRDILYGDTAVYTLRLSNPGTGDADEVAVEFGYGQERLPPKPIGTLAAGQQLELKVELNAREAGALEVVAAATAAGGLQVKTRQEVVIRRAKVDVQVAGDPVAFAGSVATYRILVRNTGDAPAPDLQAAVELPAGAKLVSGEGLKPSAEGLGVSLGTLAPNAERAFVVQCELRTAGANTLAVRVAGANEEAATGACVTRVETLADLKLTINDPPGPVATDKDAVYQLHIVNRGSKAATRVSVVAQFSQGIEPTEASGAAAQIVTGQVIFEAIPRIDPGQELTLTVHARAESEGTKRFRAEVTCQESDIQLVAQETTFFYRDATKK